MPEVSVRSTNWMAAEAFRTLARQRAAGAHALLFIVFQRGGGSLLGSLFGLDAAVDLEFLLGFFAIAATSQNPAKGIVDERVARLRLDHRPEAGQGPGFVAQIRLDLAQAEQGLRLAGPDFQRLEVMIRRVLQLSAHLEDEADVVVRRVLAGIQLKQALVHRQREV